uniref:AlNc14C327G10657 protein n=1 Tax=Albugo laibachii Nc14 TaxID=890382 RepID=F0WWP4_9STRA|nr:AlNc14C327G10657 [Albugo laibachii Nc14]|eukprot:CCA25870.1 AlNc14C327G10657 [Albugo laibachii Nc14]
MAAEPTFFADYLALLQLDARGVQSQDFAYPYLGIDSPADAVHEHLVRVPDPCQSCQQPEPDAEHQSRLLAIDLEISWEKGYATKPRGSSLLQLPKPNQKRLIPPSPFGAVSLVRIARIPSCTSIRSDKSPSIASTLTSASSGTSDFYSWMWSVALSLLSTTSAGAAGSAASAIRSVEVKVKYIHYLLTY